MVLLNVEEYEKMFETIKGMNWSGFWEDDLNGMLTAIAVEPTNDYSRFKDYRLV
jgi:hypothetical protein